jgi:multisubunit Na+/H+ antiporter MnhC subunit
VDRPSAESVLLAAIAVVAIAAAAATLPSATSPGGGPGGGFSGGSRADGGALPTPAPGPDPVLDFSFLRPILTALFAIALVALLVYAFLYRREAFRVLVGLAVIVALLALLASFAPSARLSGMAGSGLPLPFGEASGGGGEGSPSSQPLILLLVVGVVALGVVAVLVRSGARGEDEPPPGEDPGTEEVAAVARAAGRAADRIESTDDLDNEIYRAWREMTDLLDVDRPESTSPGEFAAAATGAGMAPDDVGELTRLFEDVRYGGEEPTDRDEHRALAILRRVEATYAAGEGTGTDARGEGASGTDEEGARDA